MIFTVFQYLPSLQEERGHLSELCKKAKEGDSSGDDDAPDDDSADSDSDTDFFIPQHLYWCHEEGDLLSFQTHASSAHPGVRTILTPPPKI